MRKIVLFIISGMIFGGIRAGTPEAILPESGYQPGWERQEVRFFSPENLYELINGEAELYHAYGFQKLAVADYFQRASEDSFLTVHVYDMGSPENSFGVYSSYRYPGYTFASIGTEAMISEYGIKFYQGPYFVDITLGDMTSGIQAAGREAAKKAAERIKLPAEPPPIIRLLPNQGQVPHTLKYTASQMLNQSFLPQGLTAEFTLGEETLTGFVVVCASPGEASEGLEKLRSFHVDGGDKLLEPETPIPGLLGVQTRYQGILLAAVKGRYLAGVRDADSEQIGFRLLNDILDSLD